MDFSHHFLLIMGQLWVDEKRGKPLDFEIEQRLMIPTYFHDSMMFCGEKDDVRSVF